MNFKMPMLVSDSKSEKTSAAPSIETPKNGSTRSTPKTENKPPIIKQKANRASSLGDFPSS